MSGFLTLDLYKALVENQYTVCTRDKRKMNSITVIKRVLVASLAALPTSLLYFAYEGSMIKSVGWVGTAFWIYIFAIAGCVFIGIPVYLLMQKQKVTSRLAYGLVGFISPVAVILFWTIITNDWTDLAALFNQIDHVLVFAIAGAAVALAWREKQEN